MQRKAAEREGKSDLSLVSPSAPRCCTSRQRTTCDLGLLQYVRQVGLCQDRAGAPQRDLYDLTGHLVGYESHHRKGVKLAFNTLLFGGGSKLPAGFKDKLPPKATMAKVRGAIQALHPGLSPLFGTMVGYELMFQESQILMETLKKLSSRGIVALSLHDAVIVPKTKRMIAKQIMRDASEKISGNRLPIEVDDLAT